MRTLSLKSNVIDENAYATGLQLCYHKYKVTITESRTRILQHTFTKPERLSRDCLASIMCRKYCVRFYNY